MSEQADTLPPQHQNQQPGSEAAMQPPPQSLAEHYRGSSRLAGKVALITGGDSGIGRSVAISYAKEGADVMLLYLKEHEDADLTLRHCLDQGVRTVPLAGGPIRMTMLACQADGAMYAVAFADLADPTRVGPALDQMQTALAANLGAAPGPSSPASVPGMTPNPRAQRVHVDGRFPDGTAVAQEAAFFALGTRVYQAAVMGPRLRVEALETFFGSLKVAP